MDRGTVQQGISRTWGLAEKLFLAESFSNAASLPLNEEFRDLIFSPESTYVDLYLCGLNLSHYNILLKDYSFFQFSFESIDNVRYAFYPNPFIKGSSDELENFKRRRELVTAEMITHEEYLSMIDGDTKSSGVPMFRYENAPGQRKKFAHPCSHFHIGFHSENRWPISRLLTPYAFSMLVFKAFYGDQWKMFGLREHPDIDNKFDEDLINEKTNCRLIENDLFEDVEQRSFFFG